MTFEELITDIVHSLCDHPDVSVTLTETDRVMVFDIEAPRSVRGRIIGRRGKVIHSLEILASAYSGKDGIKYLINVVDR